MKKQDTLVKKGPRQPKRLIRPLGYTLLAEDPIASFRKRTLDYLADTREGLVRDLGPTEADLTTAQVILIDRATSKLALIRAIEEKIKQRGVFGQGGDLAAVLKESYLAFCNSLRLDLGALGFRVNRRKGAKVIDLAELIRARAIEKAGQAQDAAQVEPQAQGQEGGLGQGEPEKSPPTSNAGQIQAIPDDGKEGGDNG